MSLQETDTSLDERYCTTCQGKGRVHPYLKPDDFFKSEAPEPTRICPDCKGTGFNYPDTDKLQSMREPFTPSLIWYEIAALQQESTALLEELEALIRANGNVQKRLERNGGKIGLLRSLLEAYDLPYEDPDVSSSTAIEEAREQAELYGLPEKD